MFAFCSSLPSLDLSSFSTSNVTDMSSMFYNCSGLTSLDLRNFNFSNITGYSNTISGTSANISITVKDCTQYNLFKNKFGNKSGLHTINNDVCTA